MTLHIYTHMCDNIQYRYRRTALLKQGREQDKRERAARARARANTNTAALAGSFAQHAGQAQRNQNQPTTSEQTASTPHNRISSEERQVAGSAKAVTTEPSEIAERRRRPNSVKLTQRETQRTLIPCTTGVRAV